SRSGAHARSVLVRVTVIRITIVRITIVRTLVGVAAVAVVGIASTIIWAAAALTALLARGRLMDSGDYLLHALELAGLIGVVTAAAHAVHFFFDRALAIARVGVVGKELHAAIAVLSFESLEKASQLERIVSRLGHHVRPHEIR